MVDTFSAFEAVHGAMPSRFENFGENYAKLAHRLRMLAKAEGETTQSTVLTQTATALIKNLLQWDQFLGFTDHIATGLVAAGVSPNRIRQVRAAFDLATGVRRQQAR